MIATFVAFALAAPGGAGFSMMKDLASSYINPGSGRLLLTQSRTCEVAISDDSNGSLIAWNSPGDAEGTADGLAAYVNCHNTFTQWLWCTEFGFNLPSNAIVDKVEVRITGEEGTGLRLNHSNLDPVNIQLVHNGATLGTLQYLSDYLLPTYVVSPPVDRVFDYTLWGNSGISYTTTNSQSFGVAFYLDYQFGPGQPPNPNTEVDEVEMIITYHT